MTAAAWHPDPTGRHELRYWDGTQWSEHVSDGGVQSTSPLTPPEEPTAEAGATHRAETPAAEEAATDRPDGQMDESPTEDAFMMETRVVGSPPASEQLSSTPYAETPAAEEPVAEAPMAETPNPETPMAEAPAAEAPAAAEPYPAQPYAAAPPAEPYAALPLPRPSRLRATQRCPASPVT